MSYKISRRKFMKVSAAAAAAAAMVSLTGCVPADTNPAAPSAPPFGKVQTIADGIAVKTPGNNTFELVKQYVDGIVTVSDDEIALAILTLLEQQKLIAEGAGAVPVAAVMAGKIPDIEGKNVCCLLSGGNIDVTILSRVIERGLKMGGRTADITIALSDQPGQLSGVSSIIAEHGANVVSVNYDSTDLDMNITDCFLKLGIETRDNAHIESIKQALTSAGFEVCG